MPYFGLSCSGVIHVGANIGEEVGLYSNHGIQYGIYIEPIPDVFAKLSAKCACYPGHDAIRALVSNRNGDRVKFNIANNSGQSSSMFGFGTHQQCHPQVEFLDQICLDTITLDHLLSTEVTPNINEKLDCLVIDTQGAELKVLQGAVKTLSQIKFAMIELSDEELYKGGALMTDVETFMELQGFSLVHLFINHYNWGDGFFVRNELL